MLGAILVILSLVAGAAYVALVGTGFTLLFIGAVVFMAYKRLPLIAFTAVFTLLLVGYTVGGAARRRVERLPLGAAGGAVAVQPAAAAQGAHHAAAS